MDYLLGGHTQAKDRDQGTAALSGYAVTKGCQIVRVHNVDANRDIVKTISGNFMILKKLSSTELFS